MHGHCCNLCISAVANSGVLHAVCSLCFHAFGFEEAGSQKPEYSPQPACAVYGLQALFATVLICGNPILTCSLQLKLLLLVLSQNTRCICTTAAAGVHVNCNLGLPKLVVHQAAPSATLAQVADTEIFIKIAETGKCVCS
jgi:hypothetical protein